MSGYDAYSERKGSGKKRWAEREEKKKGRAESVAELRAAEAAADRAYEAERRAEQRRAQRAAEDAYHRQRQEAQREWDRAHKSAGGGATTVSRLGHLEVLGLNATQDNEAAIRKAHRRLALRWHPDKNTSGEAPAMFRRIQAAYEALTKKEGV
jgi:hypothetical protein